MVGFVALPVGWYLQGSNLDSVLDHVRPINEDSFWAGHREEVKDAFVTSWDAYSKYAWGMSSLNLAKIDQPPIPIVSISLPGS